MNPIRRFINRIFGILASIPYRLIAHCELSLASIFGLVVSLFLILSIPLYADAVYYRALKKTITDDSEFYFPDMGGSGQGVSLK